MYVFVDGLVAPEHPAMERGAAPLSFEGDFREYKNPPILLFRTQKKGTGFSPVPS